MRPRLLSAALALALVARTAGATPEREDDAERLFREGQKLLEERRYGDACPKFEAAYAKDGNLGTLINLAFCHEEQGATWYAWLEYREAEVKALEQNRPERREFVRKRLVTLERSLTKAVVENPREEGLVDVLVEDRRIPEAEKGVPFFVEPGERKVTFRARGKKQAVAMIEFAKAAKITKVAVPAMEEAPEEPDAPPPAPPPPAPAPIVVVEPTSNGTRLAGYVALGVAGAAFVTGAVTGILTMTNPCADNFMHDKEPGCETTERRSDYDRGATMGVVSTVSFAAAAAFGAVGLTLLLTAPRARAQGISPALGAGYVGMHGAF